MDLVFIKAEDALMHSLFSSSLLFALLTESMSGEMQRAINVK